MLSATLLCMTLYWPRLARIMFFILFTWTSWMNWQTVTDTPLLYLKFQDLTWSEAYKNFINGWFAKNINPVVITTAICQAVLAVSMLAGGVIFRAGAIGAVIFFLALTPLGMGAAFPSTLVMAIAMFILLIKHPAPSILAKTVTLFNKNV